MPNLRFLYGKNLNGSIPITPGAFYLDLESNELWFDSPSDSTSDQRNKVIDSKTLIYSIETETIYYNPDEIAGETSSTTAKLGIGMLNTMVIGTE